MTGEWQATSMAEAQAIGLCVLARQRGLPQIHTLRMAVAQLHESECGWCQYPVAQLLSMLGPVVERRSGPGVEVQRPAGLTASDERDWWELPAKARLAAIRGAQA